MIDEEPPRHDRERTGSAPPTQATNVHVTLDLGELSQHLGALIERLATPTVLGTIMAPGDCGHRKLLIFAVDVCNALQSGEAAWLSIRMQNSLDELTLKLRAALKALDV